MRTARDDHLAAADLDDLAAVRVRRSPGLRSEKARPARLKADYDIHPDSRAWGLLRQAEHKALGPLYRLLIAARRQ